MGADQVVERSIAWSGRNRRLAKDYERLPRTGEMLLYAAVARLTLRRLAKRAHQNCSTASHTAPSRSQSPSDSTQQGAVAEVVESGGGVVSGLFNEP